jgi:Tfp pilus assembly protein PilO
MKLNLTSRERRTILAGGLLAVLILWLQSSYVIKPLLHERNELAHQIQSARGQLNALEAVTANESALQKQHEELKQTVASLRSLLPAERELPTAIERLSDLASQTQVKIQTISPQRSTTQPSSTRAEEKPETTAENGTAPEPVVYKEIMIQIDALAGFHQLGTFLALVESGDIPIQVWGLRISGDPKEPKRHRVKLLMRAFFATEEERQPAEGTGAKPAGTS